MSEKSATKLTNINRKRLSRCVVDKDRQSIVSSPDVNTSDANDGDAITSNWFEQTFKTVFSLSDDDLEKSDKTGTTRKSLRKLTKFSCDSITHAHRKEKPIEENDSLVEITQNSTQFWSQETTVDDMSPDDTLISVDSLANKISFRNFQGQQVDNDMSITELSSLCSKNRTLKLHDSSKSDGTSTDSKISHENETSETKLIDKGATSSDNLSYTDSLSSSFCSRTRNKTRSANKAESKIEGSIGSEFTSTCPHSKKPTNHLTTNKSKLDEPNKIDKSTTVSKSVILKTNQLPAQQLTPTLISLLPKLRRKNPISENDLQIVQQFRQRNALNNQMSGDVTSIMKSDMNSVDLPSDTPQSDFCKKTVTSKASKKVSWFVDESSSHDCAVVNENTGKRKNYKKVMQRITSQKDSRGLVRNNDSVIDKGQPEHTAWLPDKIFDNDVANFDFHPFSPNNSVNDGQVNEILGASRKLGPGQKGRELGYPSALQLFDSSTHPSLLYNIPSSLLDNDGEALKKQLSRFPRRLGLKNVNPDELLSKFRQIKNEQDAYRQERLQIQRKIKEERYFSTSQQELIESKVSDV